VGDTIPLLNRLCSASKIMQIKSDKTGNTDIQRYDMYQARYVPSEVNCIAHSSYLESVCPSSEISNLSYRQCSYNFVSSLLACSHLNTWIELFNLSKT